MESETFSLVESVSSFLEFREVEEGRHGSNKDLLPMRIIQSEEHKKENISNFVGIYTSLERIIRRGRKEERNVMMNIVLDSDFSKSNLNWVGKKTFDSCYRHQNFVMLSHYSLINI